MHSLLEKVESLDELIRSMRKIESRCRSGQIVDAWRESCRIIALLEKDKRDLIASEGDVK